MTFLARRNTSAHNILRPGGSSDGGRTIPPVTGGPDEELGSVPSAHVVMPFRLSGVPQDATRLACPCGPLVDLDWTISPSSSHDWISFPLFPIPDDLFWVLFAIHSFRSILPLFFPVFPHHLSTRFQFLFFVLSSSSPLLLLLLLSEAQYLFPTNLDLSSRSLPRNSRSLSFTDKRSWWTVALPKASPGCKRGNYVDFAGFECPPAGCSSRGRRDAATIQRRSPSVAVPGSDFRHRHLQRECTGGLHR